MSDPVDPLVRLAEQAEAEAQAEESTRRWREYGRQTRRPDVDASPRSRPGGLMTEREYHAAREASLRRAADEAASYERRRRKQA